MISSEEYLALDAIGLAAAIKSGDLSAAEAGRCAANRITSTDGSLNAIAELYEDRVDCGAASLDVDSALYGVPMLMKDAGSAENGRVQSQGSRLGDGHTMRHDSELTKRFRLSGLNIIGRTTTPEFTIAATTESELYGKTRNPWNLDYSSGGSSGGAAVAVASGYVPIAHGTDTGGSIRIPAACCGIVGFKPSRAWYGNYHVDEETVFGGLNSEFVLTRSVRDAALLFSTLKSNTPIVSDKSFFLEIGKLEAGSDNIRIAVTDKLPGVHVDPEICKAVKSISNLMSELNFTVKTDWPTYDEDAWIKADGIVWSQSIGWLVDQLASETGRRPDQSTLEHVTLLAVEESRGLTPNDWYFAMTTFQKVRRSVEQFFNTYDFLISPTVAMPAPPLSFLGTNLDISFDEFMDRTGSFSPFTALFNVSGHPAISLPAGMTSNGLPIGIQIVGRRGADISVLALAKTLEQILGFKPLTSRQSTRPNEQREGPPCH